MNPNQSPVPVAVVVGGFPELAQALHASGRFAEIVPVNSTAHLKDTMGHIGELSKRASVVFLFADNLAVDTRQTLDFLLQGLLARNQRVGVLSITGMAQKLVGQMPSLGLIPPPFTLNRVIGAISGMEGMSLLEPIDGGHEEITPGSGTFPPVGAASAVADPFSPPAPQVPAATGSWSPGSEEFAPPAPVSTAVNSGWNEPATGGWAPPADTSGTFAPPAIPQPTSPQPQEPQWEVPVVPSGEFTPPAPAVPTDFAPPSAGWNEPSPKQWEPPVELSGEFTPPAQAGIAQEHLMTPPSVDGSWQAPVVTPENSGGWAAPSDAPWAEPDTQVGWQDPQPAYPQPAVTQPPYPAPNTAYSEPVYPEPSYAPPVPQQAPQSGGFSSPWGDPSEPVRNEPGGYGAPVNPMDRAARTAPQVRRRGMVIAVASPKGGTGKSSLTLNLASYLGLALRSTGRNVCVVDSNFQQADTGKYLGNYEPNIVDLSREAGSFDPQTVGRYLFRKPDAGITALLGPATPLEGIPTQINGRLYQRVITTLREMFDYIIIDTPVAELYHDIFDNCILPEADFMIVAVAPNIPTLINADMYLRSIHADSHTGGRDFPLEKIGILLNRAEEGVDCDEEEVRLELSQWRFLGSVPESTEWKRANNNYELVAPKNYAHLNHAFCTVLYAVTQDPAIGQVLADPNFTPNSKPKKGLLDRILGKK